MRPLLLILFILEGCTWGNLKRVDVEEYQNGFPVSKYLMADLPAWANFSQTSQCPREYRNKFINLNYLGNDTSLDYHDLVQFQYSYNLELENLIQGLGGATPSLKEEEM